jgi:hypothetical protein
LIDFIKDLTKFIHFKKNEEKYDYIFFNENEFTFQYLKKILEKKNILKKTLLISIDPIKNYSHEQLNFKKKFFLKIFFLILKVKFIYATSTDLGNSIFQKSKSQKNFYIYIQHSTTSLSMIYNKKAFIEFDAIQAINKSQYNDIVDINRIHKKNIKPLISNYKFLEVISKKTSSKSIDFLIAPTWNTNFYSLNLHKEIFELLKKNNITFEFRPHFMSVKKKELNIEENFHNFMNMEKLLNFKKYKYLITDWSGIFLEFALINQTKPFLINTEKKILNKDYKEFSNLPLEISSRKEVAHEIEIFELEKIVDIIKEKDINTEKNVINNFYKKNFFS